MSKKSPRKSKSSFRPSLELLEDRLCPAITLSSAVVLPDHMVELTGSVAVGSGPVGATVTFGGAVSGSTTTDEYSNFDFTTDDASLGTVTAVSDATDNTASATIATAAPVITLSITDSSPTSVSVAGTVTGVDAAGATVVISGLADTTLTADGSGDFSTTLTTSSGGVIDANTTDSWGQASNTAEVDRVVLTLFQPGGQTNYVGADIYVADRASDSAGNDVSYSVAGLPPGLGIDDAGTITGIIANGADTGSPYSAVVTATDASADLTATASFDWTVNPSLVTLTNPGDQTNFDGDVVSLTLPAVDSLGNALSYTAYGSPAGLSVNGSTGVISGTIAGNADTGGPYTVDVRATDSTANAGLSETFNWAVNNPVSLTNPGDQTNFDGDTVSLGVSATDSANNALTYSATGLPSGLSEDPNSGVISGTIATDADTSSPYSVTVTATDSTVGASDTQTFNWTVGQALLVAVQGDQYNAPGDTVSVPLYSWDVPGNAVAFSATGLPSGLSIDASTGTISGTISYGATSSSPYSVTVTAADAVADVSTNASFSWNVVAPTIYMSGPASLESVVGSSGSVSVIAVDTTSNAALDYSASGLPTGLSINGTTGDISGTIDSNANENSPYSVTVTATDENADVSANVNFTWTVSHLVVLNPGDRADLVGDTVSLTVAAPYADAGTLAFSATGLPAGLGIDTVTGVISGTIASDANTGSPYSVTVTATDGTLTASKTFAWNVQQLLMTNVGNQYNVDGDVVPLTVPVTAPAGHTITYSVTGLPDGTYTTDNSTGVITWTVPAGAHENSPYQMTITATDTNTGASLSQTITWTVEAHVSACAADLAEEEETLQQQQPADLNGIILANLGLITAQTREINLAYGRINDEVEAIAALAVQYATTDNAALRANYASLISIRSGRVSRELGQIDTVGQLRAQAQARRIMYLWLEAYGPFQFP